MAITFVHHVYFWLKNPNNPEDLQKLQEGVKSLGTIASIKEFHIGRPAGTNRGVIDTTYSLSWLALFETAEDEAYYQTDPVHLKFVEDCASLWEKVIVYDSVNI